MIDAASPNAAVMAMLVQNSTGNGISTESSRVVTSVATATAIHVRCSHRFTYVITNVLATMTTESADARPDSAGARKMGQVASGMIVATEAAVGEGATSPMRIVRPSPTNARRYPMATGSTAARLRIRPRMTADNRRTICCGQTAYDSLSPTAHAPAVNNPDAMAMIGMTMRVGIHPKIQIS